MFVMGKALGWQYFRAEGRVIGMHAEPKAVVGFTRTEASWTVLDIGSAACLCVGMTAS